MKIKEIVVAEMPTAALVAVWLNQFNGMIEKDGKTLSSLIPISTPETGSEQSSTSQNGGRIWNGMSPKCSRPG